LLGLSRNASPQVLREDADDVNVNDEDHGDDDVNENNVVVMMMTMMF